MLTDSACMRAWLKLERPDRRMTLQPDAVISVLEDLGIPITDQLIDRVQSALASIDERSDVVTLIDLAEGRPPTPGRDGRVNWKVPSPRGRTTRTDRSGPPERGVIVQTGEVIATVDEPTAGEAGVDVFGKAVPASVGRPVSLQPGQGVAYGNDHSELVAETSGRMRLDGQTLSVKPVCEIDGSVGIVTGDVDFPGSVVIHGSVQPGFRVYAGGSVEVFGNVESATIDCDGDLLVHGGINGKGKGSIRCGGSLRARFLNGVKLQVARDVEVHSSIIRCDVVVGGEVRIEREGITASRVICRGDVHSPVIRSRKLNDTVIEVGVDEEMALRRREVRHEIVDVRRQRNSTRYRLGVLVREPERINEFEPKRREALAARLERYRELVVRYDKLLLQLEGLVAEGRYLLQTRIYVDRRISRGTLVRIARAQMYFRSDRVGPLELSANPQGTEVQITRP